MASTKYKLVVNTPAEIRRLNTELGTRLKNSGEFAADSYHSSRDLTSKVYHVGDATVRHFRFRSDYQLEVFGSEEAKKDAIGWIGDSIIKLEAIQ